MKYSIIACLIFASCRISNLPKQISVTVDYVLRSEGDSSEIWAKRRRMYNNPGYVWYVSKVAEVPDTIKPGKKINLILKDTSCASCIVFKLAK